MLWTRLKMLMPGMTTLHFSGGTVHLLMAHPATFVAVVVAAALLGGYL